MKIALIGASGHSGMLCIPQTFDPDRQYVGVAAGSAGESVQGTLARLRELGYAPAAYDDYRTMLRETKPDVVVVDNFYGEHAPVICDAFRAGCHVFAEKPVGATPAELDALYDAWRTAGTEFAAMLNYRYDGAFYRAWSLVQAGAIGRVRLLNGQKSYKFGTRPNFMTHRATYGGTLEWVGVHAIDWVLWFSGAQFESVSALQCAAEAANARCPETTALAQYRMTNGVMASVTVDYLNPQTAPVHGDDRIRAVGTAGVIEVRGGAVTLINQNGAQHPENAPAADMFADFLRQTQGTGQCRISGEESFAANYGAVYAQLAADEGRTVMFPLRG